MSKYIQQKKEVWLVGIFGLYLVFSFLVTVPGFGRYDIKRIVQLATVIIFFVGWWFTYGNTTLKVPKNKCFVLVSLFFLTGFISASISLYPRSALLEVSYFLLLFLAVILIGNLITFSELGKLILLSSVIYTGLYLLLFIGNYISAHISPFVPLWPDRLSFELISSVGYELTKEVVYFTNKRFFNHTQTATLPILIAFLSYAPVKKAWSIFIFIFVSLWWCLVIASGARGTTLAVLFAIFFLAFKDYNNGKQFIKYAFYTAIAGIFLYILLYIFLNPSEVTTPSLVRSSDQGRPNKWSVAIDLWYSNPILGLGPYHFAILGITEAAHPHNFYLQILAEWGIVAFSLLSISGFFFLKWLFYDFDIKDQYEKEINRVYRVGFSTALLAILAHSFVSGNFHTPISQIWILLLLAWFYSFWLAHAKQDSIISFRINIIKSVLIGVVIVLSIIIHDDLKNLDESQNEYLSSQGENSQNVISKKLRPRFWEQGIIYESLHKDEFYK